MDVMHVELADTEAVIRRAYDLWNQGNLKEYLACYDSDVEWAMPGARGRGLKGIPEELASELTALPDCHIDIQQIVASGDRAAVELTITGTNTGPISLRDGSTRSATGKRIFRGVAVIDRKSTRLNSSHIPLSRMPSSA